MANDRIPTCRLDYKLHKGYAEVGMSVVLNIVQAHRAGAPHFADVESANDGDVPHIAEAIQYRS